MTELVKRLIELREKIASGTDVAHAREQLRKISLEDLDTIIAALSTPEGEWVLVPKSALDWLMGEGPDANGRWFGDRSPQQTKPIGPYWWRSEFRAMIAASPLSKENEHV